MWTSCCRSSCKACRQKASSNVVVATNQEPAGGRQLWWKNTFIAWLLHLHSVQKTRPCAVKEKTWEENNRISTGYGWGMNIYRHVGDSGNSRRHTKRWFLSIHYRGNEAKTLALWIEQCLLPTVMLWSSENIYFFRYFWINAASIYRIVKEHRGSLKHLKPSFTQGSCSCWWVQHY